MTSTLYIISRVLELALQLGPQQAVLAGLEEYCIGCHFKACQDELLVVAIQNEACGITYALDRCISAQSSYLSTAAIDRR